MPIISKYRAVSYIRNNQNIGPAASRNIGIKSSNGSLISFLDADDVWDTNKLLYSVREFEKNGGIGMTCGNYRIMTSSRVLKPFYKKSIAINHGVLMKNNYVASGSVTVKRSVIDDVGLFNKDYWIAEDYDLWLRISEKYPIKYIHKILYYYRIVKGGRSLTQRDDVQRAHEFNLSKIKKESVRRLKEDGGS
jgi:cellulose synthase/poly-beta-1,6-N-acetylglucosamine synthase-like glycosyltransferase